MIFVAAKRKNNCENVVPLITRFDPWQSSQCTCPPKLTFNPYTGCCHNCVYCYASSYVPRFSDCRPKKDLLKRLEREALKLRGETVSLSNSSDPYPQMERELGLTRECLRILSRSKCRIQVVTKSTLVTRDIDLLNEASATVALTITTDNNDLAKRIEPNAPSATERLRTVETLVSKGVPVSVRIDPVIPFVNDDPAKLVAELASLGVKHVTASTYKVKRDNWKRFCAAMPAMAEKLKPLYFEHGEKANGCLLLPRDLRLKLLTNIRRLVLSHGIMFGACREGLSQLNTAVCDGSWLLPKLET